MTDRTLDALVAEKVMGWTEVGPRVTADGRNEIAGHPPGNLPSTLSYAPHYSSTGDGMLAVIEKMRDRGWVLWLLQDFGQWTVKVWTGPWDDGAMPTSRTWPKRALHCEVMHPSLPRAVSLAALKALGVEV